MAWAHKALFRQRLLDTQICLEVLVFHLSKAHRTARSVLCGSGYCKQGLPPELDFVGSKNRVTWKYRPNVLLSGYILERNQVDDTDGRSDLVEINIENARVRPSAEANISIKRVRGRQLIIRINGLSSDVLFSTVMRYPLTRPTDELYRRRHTGSRLTFEIRHSE